MQGAADPLRQNPGLAFTPLLQPCAAPAIRHRQQFATERIPILRRQPLRERGQIVALLRIQPPQDRQQAIAFGGRDVSEQRLQARPVGAQVRTQPPALPLHRVQHAELRAQRRRVVRRQRRDLAGGGAQPRALYFMMLITALISLVLTTWVNT